MKRLTLAAAILALAVAMSACTSKKNTTDPTSEALPTESVEAGNQSAIEPTGDGTANETTKKASDETKIEIQLDYSSGAIVKLQDNILTVLDDFEDIEMTFDISNASIISDFPMNVGDYVEVSFPEGESGDVIGAVQVEVLDSAMENSDDPIMVGIVREAGDDFLYLTDNDGDDFEFTTGNAYIVTGNNGLKSDMEVQVTYLGEAGEDAELMAIKIVTEEAYGTAAANINAFIGEIDSVQDGSIVLIAETGDYMTFTSSTLDFTSFAEGTIVQISYEGSIGAKEIPATAISAK